VSFSTLTDELRSPYNQCLLFLSFYLKSSQSTAKAPPLSAILSSPERFHSMTVFFSSEARGTLTFPSFTLSDPLIVPADLHDLLRPQVLSPVPKILAKGDLIPAD